MPETTPSPFYGMTSITNRSLFYFEIFNKADFQHWLGHLKIDIGKFALQLFTK